MASKPKPALTRGSLAPGETRAPRVPGVRRGPNQSGFISETASTISASQQSASLGGRQQLRLENTYKMAPDATFSPKRVEDAMHSVLQSYLCDYSYDAKTCARLTCDLANMIKARVREMGYDRYKIVCQVIIGEKEDQGVAVVSRFLWDHKNDTHATATFSNEKMYAVANVYGLYFE